MTLIEFESAPSPSMQRWFGLSLAGLLLIFAFLLRHTSINIAIFLSVVAALSVMVYYSLPATQYYIIRAWQRLTHPLAWAVSHALLATVFFLVVFPMGMIARMIGYDPLRLRRRDSSTNWTERRSQDDVSRYFKQF